MVNNWEFTNIMRVIRNVFTKFHFFFKSVFLDLLALWRCQHKQTIVPPCTYRERARLCIPLFFKIYYAAPRQRERQKTISTKCFCVSHFTNSNVESLLKHVLLRCCVPFATIVEKLKLTFQLLKTFNGYQWLINCKKLWIYFFQVSNV